MCKKTPNCLQKWLYNFASSLKMNENPCCFASLSAFGVVNIPGIGYSNRGVVVFHCRFNLHFSNDMWYEHLFWCLFPDVYFFSDVSVRMLTHFKIMLFVFFLLTLSIQCIIFWICFANNFFQSVVCILILSMSFAKKDFFFNFNEIQLKIIHFMGSYLGVVSKKSLPHFRSSRYSLLRVLLFSILYLVLVFTLN